MFPTVFIGALVLSLPSLIPRPPSLSVCLLVGLSLPLSLPPSLSIYSQIMKDFMAVGSPRATPTITAKTVLKLQMGTDDCVLKQAPTETEGQV